MFKPISFSCQIEEGLLQELKFFVSACMQRAQFVKVLSSSQELTNLSSKLPGEVEKDYLQFTDVEAKHRRIKWLVSGHVQGTAGCRGTCWFGAGTKESGPVSFFSGLFFFFPRWGKHLLWAFAYWKFWESFGELQSPWSLQQGLSVMVLMLAIKNGRERPWLDALDVKEYILAEWGELGNPPKGFDYYPGPQVFFS